MYVRTYEHTYVHTFVRTYVRTHEVWHFDELGDFESSALQSFGASVHSLVLAFHNYRRTEWTNARTYEKCNQTDVYV